MKINFRGLLADGEQRRIRLSTNDGMTGYQITKFQLMDEQPGAKTLEGVCKIYATEQSAVDGVVNFESPLLLGASQYHKEQNVAYPGWDSVIFDSTKINQDVFITWKDNATGEKINYYIELEKVKLNLDEATVATLKDMRGRE